MIRRLIRSFSDEVWNIGFIQNCLGDILEGKQIQVKWVKHDFKNSWFADPFILDVTENEIHILAEEFYKPIQRGRISRLIIDKGTFGLKQRDVVLELPTHLSFPAIIRRDGEIFIYPENGESGELNLYQYFPETNECRKVKTILHEVVADAVMMTIEGMEYLFCTKPPKPNGNVLNVYKRDDSGVFKAVQEYAFEENVARMAGDFFEYQGEMFRPAQECNVQYGHAVLLQKMIREDGRFIFDEVRRLHSVHPSLNVGMHTLNMYKGMIVTDALGFRNMWIRRILKKLKIIP